MKFTQRESVYANGEIALLNWEIALKYAGNSDTVKRHIELGYPYADNLRGTLKCPNAALSHIQSLTSDLAWHTGKIQANSPSPIINPQEKGQTE